MKKIKGKPIHFHACMLAMSVMTALLIIFIIFRHQLENKMKNTAETNLLYNASAIAEIFHTKLDDQLVMLESQARYFKDIELSDYNAMKKTIMSTKGISSFKTIGVANLSGATINYNGTSSGNVYLEEYYKEAIKGNNAISKSIVVDESGDEVLVLAVPIRKEEGITGIIYGTFTKNTLNSILDSVSSSEDAFHVLVNADGQILAKTTDTEISFGETIPESALPKDSSTKIDYYTINGKKFIAVLVPIGIHDWYFINILPEYTVSQQTSQIVVDVVLTVICVFAIFITVLFYVLHLLRRNESISNVNERFRLAAAQSHNIVFSYDYKSETMTIEGNAKLIISNPKDFYTSEDIKHFFSLLHPEDSKLYYTIRKIYKTGQTAVLSEFRLKCTDNQYYWFRMNASVIRDKNEKPVQIIGSIFNVDEQMNKEIKLMERAQTDSLTGLLNKGTYHTKVCNLLEERANHMALILFIIDLDNFKAVNDNLGHAMGDQVLTDVAGKLTSIFGNKNSVGRIGGDEFSAFLMIDYSEPEKAQQLIQQKASLICQRLKETYCAFQIEVSVSASVGIAICPEHGTNYDVLYKEADSALYQIKKHGKNSYAIYNKEEHYEKM